MKKNQSKRFDPGQHIDSIAVRQTDLKGLEYAFRNGGTYLEADHHPRLKEFEVSCRKCKRHLVTFFTDPGVPGKMFNGKYFLQEDDEGKVTKGLLALRPRLDGELGLECCCGADNRFDDDLPLAKAFVVKQKRRN